VPGNASEGEIPRGLRCIRIAYPETVCGVTSSALALCNGKRIAWDDGRGIKPYAQFLEQADLEDMMQQRYRAGVDLEALTPPRENFEPGRIRHEAFFRAMYGETAAEVSADLVEVPWLPRSGGGVLSVTRKNGVAAALRAVSDELEQTMPPPVLAILAKTAGGFFWRKVKGSVRRSNHSFAIAVDVGMGRSDYWDWRRPDAQGRYAYRNRFPIEAVPAFERRGFVWGGKWYHYDTMHFEYRPELLVAPCVEGPSPLVPGLLGSPRP
jgi:hypothetical protein